MNVIVFGATGMVGQGVLRECLESPEVKSVLSVGRNATGLQHPKLKELVRGDLYDYGPVASELKGYDACFFCLGISSVGMKEDAYRRITYDLTVAAAKVLLAQNPAMTFCYVSGASTDSTGKGSSMWARVKGQTENELLKMGFKAAFMFRPGYIQPMHGIKSKTGAYRLFYAVMAPLYPVWKAIIPSLVTTNENIGKAMIRVAQRGYSSPHVETKDINALAA